MKIKTKNKPTKYLANKPLDQQHPSSTTEPAS